MKTIKDFESLLPAEQKLLDACKNGEMAKISDVRPTGRTADNEIRADFLRTLILCEKDNIDPKGIQFQGAYVSGVFDFESCETNLPFSFWRSFFEEEIVLMRSKIRLLGLGGSEAAKGINANGLRCDDIVFLGDGFTAKGKVDFISAQIGSNLECINGTFENENGDALNCNGAKIAGSVFLTDGFTAKGIVNFVAVQIDSSLICADAKIDGFLGLDSAKAKDLRDNDGLWRNKELESIPLNGFVYEHIHNDWQAEKRKKWLAKMPEFKPQPYKQLAKVLRDMGHVDDANEIMIEYHDRRSEEFKSRLKKFFFGAYKLFSDYGYSPSKVVKWMGAVWLACSAIYWHAANVGVFAPSNPIVFQSKDYNCSPTEVSIKDLVYKEENGSKNWYYSSLKGEYTTFQPFLYSLDVILPVVDLYAEKDWGVFIPTPSGYFDWLNPTTITFNHIVRLVVWLEIIFGWALSLILVAILSGLAKNEKD